MMRTDIIDGILARMEQQIQNIRTSKKWRMGIIIVLIIIAIIMYLW